MCKYKNPLILTIIITILLIVTFCFFDKDQYAAIGSLVGGFGSVIAIIWFFASLQYQAQQLEEQRGQFTKEFQKINEDGRRNSLVLAKNILDETENRALTQKIELKNITELMIYYMKHAPIFRQILVERDLATLQECTFKWYDKVEPANILMRGIKSAAGVYFGSIGINDIDYSKEPELFIHEYGNQFWDEPFFNSYKGTAMGLAALMTKCIPQRDTVHLAFSICLDRLGSDGRNDELGIIASINDHKAKGYPMPQIVKIYQ
ncbi:MAG: hypothetical protein GY777_19650 [Candidatus Brocadiaceae bacterium]|nr:hypothetical protein [Candidatus Brocadiaceae bacterium]